MQLNYNFLCLDIKKRTAAVSHQAVTKPKVTNFLQIPKCNTPREALHITHGACRLRGPSELSTDLRFLPHFLRPLFGCSHIAADFRH